MTRSRTAFVVFCVLISACSLGTAPATLSQTPNSEESAACPPLRYAENPTEAVSALPVQIGGFFTSNRTITAITDLYGGGISESIDGLNFRATLNCVGTDGRSYECFQRDSTRLQMHYVRDGLHYDFQTFYRFKLRGDQIARPVSQTSDGRSWTQLGVGIVPRQVPHRPWFLLIPDSDCPARAVHVSLGSITDYEYAPALSNPSFYNVEHVTQPTAGHILIEWDLIKMPVDQWMYFAFVTQATELLMSSGEDTQGTYLAMEKRHYGNGLTVVESCGKVYNPAVTDFVRFAYIPNDVETTLFRRGENYRLLEPLPRDTLDSLAYWWNRRHGGLSVDFWKLLIPESAYQPLIPWYSATVHIGSCSRTFLYYISECGKNHFAPSSIKSSCDNYLGGTPAYRLWAGKGYFRRDQSIKPPQNFWYFIML